jgi:hypothetical protein
MKKQPLLIFAKLLIISIIIAYFYYCCQCFYLKESQPEILLNTLRSIGV